METGDGSSGRRKKVVRLIEKHDLDGIGVEMAERWTADGDERLSLRELADHFNRQVLAATMLDAGMDPLPGEVENVYELLTADDVSPGDRTRVERRLEREGVDIEDLRSDFLTYQAVRTYLKQDREAEYVVDEGDRTETERDSIQRLRRRAVKVTESKLERLRRNDRIDLGDFRTVVDISVHCTDCGRRYGVDELLERGGCDCVATHAE